MAITVYMYRSQKTKMSLVILQEEYESMMYSLNKEAYNQVRKDQELHKSKK